MPPCRSEQPPDLVNPPRGSADARTAPSRSSTQAKLDWTVALADHPAHEVHHIRHVHTGLTRTGMMDPYTIERARNPPELAGMHSQR